MGGDLVAQSWMTSLAEGAPQRPLQARPAVNFVDAQSVADLNRSPRLQKLTANPLAKQWHIVRLTHVAQAQQNGVLSFSLPGWRRVSARANSVEQDPEGNLVWAGIFEDEEGGSMTMVGEDDHYQATLHAGSRIYEIHHLQNDLHLLMEIDPAKFPVGGCGNFDMSVTEEGLERMQAQPPSNGRIAACNNPVRVLALVTPAARQTGINVNQRVNEAISQFNTVAINSGVTSANGRLVLASLRDYNFSETKNISEDRDHIINDLTVAQWRQTAGADLVIAFTNGTLGNYIGVFGIAGTLNLDANRAYAIVQLANATSTLTFTHEVGHLFSARHQTCDVWNAIGCTKPEDEMGFRHGFSLLKKRTFAKNIRKASVVHQLRPDYDRQPNFSNPGVITWGESVGTATRHNNGTHINNVAWQVAGFNPFTQLSSSIDGPSQISSIGNHTWEAVVSCGSSPYTYAWSRSPDGFSYYPVSNQDRYTTFVGEEGTFYLRLQVRSADNQLATSYRTVQVGPCCGGGYYRTVQAPEEPVAEPAALEAYPNPVTTETTLAFVLAEEQHVELELLDTFGRSVRHLTTGHYPAGRHEVKMDGRTLAAGLYHYRLRTETGVQTRYLVVVR